MVDFADELRTQLDVLDVVFEVVCLQGVSELDSRAEPVDDHLDDVLVLFLELLPHQADQVHQNGQLDPGAVFRPSVLL